MEERIGMFLELFDCLESETALRKAKELLQEVYDQYLEKQKAYKERAEKQRETKEKKKKQVKVSEVEDKSDPEINECLNIIKDFNMGTIDGTHKEQRIWGKNLVGKIKGMDAVKNGKNTRQEILMMIFKSLEGDKYYASKLSSPKKLYENRTTLTSRARTLYQEEKQKQDTSYILPGING